MKMTTLAEVEAAAMQLDQLERSLLVNRLSASLDVPEGDLELPPVDPVWVEVAKRRLRELEDGTVQPLDGDEVMKRMWELARQ